MTRPVFLDTSGFFAILDRKDRDHDLAKKVFSDIESSSTKLITTDYVLSETYTLLKSKGLSYRAGDFKNMIWDSKELSVVWTDQARFEETENFLVKHIDKGYSFTDCLSFIVMRNLDMSEALTADKHFEQAGFKVLLATT